MMEHNEQLLLTMVREREAEVRELVRTRALLRSAADRPRAGEGNPGARLRRAGRRALDAVMVWAAARRIA